MKLSRQKLMEIIKEELDDEWFGPPPGDLYMEADEAVLKVILDDLTGARGLEITRPEIAEPIAAALVRIAKEIREGAGLGGLGK
jgi:hypothetical protein